MSDDAPARDAPGLCPRCHAPLSRHDGPCSICEDNHTGPDGFPTDRLAETSLAYRVTGVTLFPTPGPKPVDAPTPHEAATPSGAQAVISTMVPATTSAEQIATTVTPLLAETLTSAVHSTRLSEIHVFLSTPDAAAHHRPFDVAFVRWTRDESPSAGDLRASRPEPVIGQRWQGEWQPAHDPVSTRVGMTEPERRAIFRSLVEIEERAQHTADVTVPIGRGAALDDIVQNRELADALIARDLAELRLRHRITDDAERVILEEGHVKHWPVSF